MMNNILKLLIFIFMLFAGVTIILLAYTTHSPAAQIQIPKHEIETYTKDNPLFVIKTIKTNTGIQLSIGDNFSYTNGNDLPIDVQGTTTLNSTKKIWTVLRDIYGHYYLQHPPVTILDSTSSWDASNIQPRDNISFIYFYLVNADGNLLFNKMLLNNNWSAFEVLPTGSKELSYIKLTNRYDMVYSITKKPLTISVSLMNCIQILSAIISGLAGLIAIYEFLTSRRRKAIQPQRL